MSNRTVGRFSNKPPSVYSMHWVVSAHWATRTVQICRIYSVDVPVFACVLFVHHLSRRPVCPIRLTILRIDCKAGRLVSVISDEFH